MTADRGRDRVAVVTGGADGLGLATTRRLLDDGYRVAVIDLQDAADLISERCLTFQGDVSDAEFVRNVARDVDSAWGRVDALVNNAGIFPRTDADAVVPSEWERVLSVNLSGTFFCSQVFAPLLRRHGGAIVNTASGQVFRPRPRSAAYSASKGAIVALTRALAVEWAPAIRVNCVVPGIADTAMPRLERSEESLRGAGKAIPMGRIGAPADTAAAVAFLISDDAVYITGQMLAVNGGAFFT